MAKILPFSIALLVSYLVLLPPMHERVMAQQAAPQPATSDEGPTPFIGDIARLAGENSDFRRVLSTGANLQLVLMTLNAGETIGQETHPNIDQCIFVVEGSGQVVLNGEVSPLSYDQIVCIPAGTEHDVQNTGREAMRLFTIYGPPQHPPGTVHATRADAEEAERTDGGSRSR